MWSWDLASSGPEISTTSAYSQQALLDDQITPVNGTSSTCIHTEATTTLLGRDQVFYHLPHKHITGIPPASHKVQLLHFTPNKLLHRVNHQKANQLHPSLPRCLRLAQDDNYRLPSVGLGGKEG